MLLDMHAHTTASDGTYKPDEILQLAYEKRLVYFSITDHDTLDGVKKVQETPRGMTFIPGLEISAEYPATLHILGYGIDPFNAELNERLKELQNFRKNRNSKMLTKMKQFGFHVTMDELIDEAGSELVGRPHFANIMLRKGYVDTYQDAFDRYLKKGAPLYLNKKRLDPALSIDLIHQAGGIAVMAHPYQTKLEGEELEALVRKLVSYGLDGIEVYYSKHTPGMVTHYQHLSEQFNLLRTAGSDFHGSNKPDIELGMDIQDPDIFKTLERLS